jgi:hypothetical protein
VIGLVYATFALKEGFTQFVSASTPYTHSQIVENPVDPGSVGQQLFGVPKNKASAMVAYAGPSGFKAAMRVRYQQAHAVIRATHSLSPRTPCGICPWRTG